jgi:hypothetical protein
MTWGIKEGPAVCECTIRARLAMEGRIECNNQGDGGGERRLAAPKVSAVIEARIRQKDSALQQCNGYGIYYG